VLALPVPNMPAYDPAFAYELAVILQDGLKRMYQDGEDIFYYITLMNENYPQPPMPEPREETRQGILKGLYLFQKSELKKPKARVQLLGSGTILNEVIKAAQMLSEYHIAADVWSVTSYKALYYEAIETARFNRLNPSSKARLPYIAQCLNATEGPIVAASDYMKVLPSMVSGYLNRPIHSLGTDGFGRSETREALRDFFEVDAKHVVIAALSALRGEGKVNVNTLTEAIKTLGIDPKREAPHKR
jgi:pyruvate dehydrogenase E1 component